MFALCCAFVSSNREARTLPSERTCSVIAVVETVILIVGGILLGHGVSQRSVYATASDHFSTEEGLGASLLALVVLVECVVFLKLFCDHNVSYRLVGAPQDPDLV